MNRCKNCKAPIYPSEIHGSDDCIERLVEERDARDLRSEDIQEEINRYFLESLDLKEKVSKLEDEIWDWQENGVPPKRQG